MKILALGLGEEQINAIEYAIKQGLYVIGIDRSEDLPGVKLVHEFYEIDLKDVYEIYDKVKNVDIQFIIPSTIGSLLTTVGKLNDLLNLPGVNYEYSKILTDKESYYQSLIDRNLYVPKRIISNSESYNLFIEQIKELKTPFILKPSKGSGSRGVIMVLAEEDLKQAYKYAQESLLNDEVLIAEEFVEGQEYGVDFRIEEGKITILSIRTKILTAKPYRQEVGYLLGEIPSSIYERILKQLNIYFENELKVTNVLGNLDIIVNDQVAYMVEMALRPAGLGIMYNYLPHVIGFNPVHNMIDVLSNKSKYTMPVFSQENTYLFLLDLPQGEVVEVPSDEEILNLSYVKNYRLDIKVGDILRQVRSGRDIMPRGYLIMSGNNEKELLKQKDIIFRKFLVKKDD